jgi:hypothetical protein
MQIPQQVNPAALMQAGIIMVATIEVTDQYSLKSLQHLLRHTVATALVEDKVTHPRRGETPYIPILPALSPTGFVGMDIPTPYRKRVAIRISPMVCKSIWMR